MLDFLVCGIYVSYDELRWPSKTMSKSERVMMNCEYPFQTEAKNIGQKLTALKLEVRSGDTDT